MSQEIDIVVLDASGVTAAASDLGRVLADCVAGGASVSFMHPFTPGEAAAYFRKVADEVARGDVIVLAARRRGTIVGTVQLMIATPPNQSHRADVRKLLVLDTAREGDAERLYARGGWVRVGVIPHYALMPDGAPCDTVIFWKRL